MSETSERLYKTLKDNFSGDLNFFLQNQKARSKSPADRPSDRQQFATNIIFKVLSERRNDYKTPNRLDYDCQPEEIAAYLIELFSLNEADFHRLLTKHNPTADEAGSSKKINTLEDSTRDEFLCISDHLRLYSNCLLQQATSIDSKQLKRVVLECQLDVSLENLLPGVVYSLIDRYGASTSLSEAENMSLRRSSLLAGALNLDGIKDTASMIILFMTIAKNDYLAALPNLIFMNNVSQISPLRNNQPTRIESRNFILDLEFLVIKDFVRKFLANRLRDWIIQSESVSKGKRAPETAITLVALRLIKSIIKYHTLQLSHISDRIISLRNSVRSTLKLLITEHFRGRLTDLINNNQESKLRGPRRKGNKDSDGADSWRKLLCDIQLVNNDLKLYWSNKGLDGVVQTGVQLVTDEERKRLSNSGQQTTGLYKIIEEKLNAYLK